MDVSDILLLLEQLDDEIDDLEDSLAPLLNSALSNTAAKLPLVDKAKLCVLVTYAIESIIFSYLRLNGVKAREHPVFTELTRVKQYFDKIKVAETPIQKRENLSVDKQAAARFIKAGLSGNSKYDLERAEKQAKERARSHIKFQDLSRQRTIPIPAEEPKATIDAEDSRSGSSDSDSDSHSSAEEAKIASPAPKKRRKIGTSKS